MPVDVPVFNIPACHVGVEVPVAPVGVEIVGHGRAGEQAQGSERR
jgi:hypothetical protein